MWSDQLDELEAVVVVHERFPDLAARGLRAIHGGWDTHAFVVDEAWIVRVPRRPDAEAQLLQEVELLRCVAAFLPSRVPAIERVSRETPVCVVARWIYGTPATASPRTAAELGSFLKVLHGLPVESLPVPPSTVADWRAQHEVRRSQFEASVFPLLDVDERHRAADLFSSVHFEFEPALVHGDLCPDHVLCAPDGHIEAVIDWGDARSGDPAIDLAWPLHGASPAFAEAVLATYGDVAEEVLVRARFYYRRGPWYEVLYGLETGRPEFVQNGLAGVRARL